MKQPPVLIKKIRQKSNTAFEIEWSDGLVMEYRLSALQKRCPCALCYDPATGEQIPANQMLDADVRALLVHNVGRYALRIYLLPDVPR